jgi:hypothetical protein
MVRIALVLLAAAALEAAPEYRAGVARQDITPEEPIRMAGYASRTKPSDGVAMRLWAKAVALEHRGGSRIVIVTTDLLGLPRSVSDPVAARVQSEHGLERSRLLLNSSHTHAAPIVWPSGRIASDLRDEEKRIVMEYRNALVEQLARLVSAALKNLTPVEIGFGTGEARFAMNRREKTPKGIRLGVNPGGPGDPSVPVLRIANPDGSTKAVIFGYACHATTLTGSYERISGDYPGQAQAELERQMPGSTALFLTLAGGDQNPEPRGTAEHVKQHGDALAAEVKRIATGKLEPIRGDIRAAFAVRDLALAEPLKPSVPYPVQAVRFGKSATLLALGGEVVVEYALRVKRDFPKERMIVAAYSNDVMAYVPTKAMLSEGGYEPVDSMKYYDFPSPFADDVEERVHAAIRDVLKRVGVK